jgi:hypothetical protein
MTKKNTPHPEVPSHLNDETLAKLQADLERQFRFGIPRKSIGEATGGILHPRTMANQDSLGTGIEGRFMIGNQTVYPVAGVIEKIRRGVRPVKAR